MNLALKGKNIERANLLIEKDREVLLMSVLWRWKVEREKEKLRKALDR